MKVLRVLCREDLGISGASSFADDVERTMKWLNTHVIQTPEQVSCLLPTVVAVVPTIGMWFRPPNK